MCSKYLILSFYILLLSMPSNLFIATDTISQGQSISGNQTIVSEEGKFELGFITPGNSLNYYVGIWYKKIPNQTVIWVANRETPVSDPAASELKLTTDGNLALFSDSEIPVWSSNSSSPSSAISNIAILLDTGNLVLRDNINSSSIVWQSFDHPTDTTLPGSWIGLNKITGEYVSLTSWKNSDDPAPGPFTDGLDPNGTNQFMLLWNSSKSYWSSGVWNGNYFPSIPAMSESSMFKYEDDNKRTYFMWNLSDNRALARGVLSSSGQRQYWMWFDDTQYWELVSAAPVFQCDIYSVCGAFGICDETSTPVCSCPPGFKQTSMRDWSSGCTRNTHLQCGRNNSTSSQKDGFWVMPNVQFPTDSQQLLMVSTAEECELACLNKCSCIAYAYENSCSIWNGDIRNLQRISKDGNNTGTLYIRLAASDLPHKNSEKKLIIKIIISVATGITLIMILAFSWKLCTRIRGKVKSLEGTLVSFTYSEILRVTRNFSEKIGGGGFGPVFKGCLPDLTVVAVKKLEGIRQGEKQFRNELRTLGTIQHVNVVQLRGFCSEGTERLLVYDYVPKGSLDHYLFQKESQSLDWKTRYGIILGIARGLTYLHEECRECIIHCDIKPENVLVDSAFCPKLSDFGMAKLIGHDFSRVLTTMKGTIGYLAPEWIEGLPITPKADVYSFGMLLFEVVSGRRNTEYVNDGGIGYFPIRAADKVLRNEVISLLDESLEGCADMMELNRVCRVACWCIQDSEEERPSMSRVVNMLEGILDVDMPPIPRRLQRLAEEEEEEEYHTHNLVQSIHVQFYL